jgi:hypothetical protein
LHETRRTVDDYYYYWDARHFRDGVARAVVNVVVDSVMAMSALTRATRW